jgi:hypothetical protein
MSSRADRVIEGRFGWRKQRAGEIVSSCRCIICFSNPERNPKRHGTVAQEGKMQSCCRSWSHEVLGLDTQPDKPCFNSIETDGGMVVEPPSLQDLCVRGLDRDLLFQLGGIAENVNCTSVRRDPVSRGREASGFQPYPRPSCFIGC